jgi:hypothetical protein
MHSSPVAPLHAWEDFGIGWNVTLEAGGVLVSKEIEIVIVTLLDE